MQTTDTITTAALADMLGISTRSIRQHAKDGILVRAGKEYALAPSVRAYCDHLRKLATGRGGEAAMSTATAQRARLAKAQADFVETKNKRASGELVPAAEVETAWSGVLRTVRAGLLAVPSRVQQRLPHLTAHDVSEIDREVRDVLTDLGSAHALDEI
jgi:terminase small subunit / prophage DNA-packing protein